jgi:prophage regulatory protein
MSTRSDKILREKEVFSITGLSRSTRWRLEKAGLFPPRRSLGNNSVGWLDSEINHWIEKLKIVVPSSKSKGGTK